MTAEHKLDLAGMRTIGADLDLTLLDTRAATAYALHEVNRQCGEAVDVGEFVSRLGPPIRQELARFIAPERLDEAIRVFRACFVGDGLARLTLLPGARELATALRRIGGRLVVITSRLPEIADACLASVALPADVLVGGLSGEEKGPAMAEHGVQAYAGDHPLDMAGAVAAGVPGIGITTGRHDAGELWRAGATWVVDDLTAVVAALDRYQ